MIKTSIEKISKEIGYDIGLSDDIVQSDLLNGFCKGLTNSIKDKFAFESQLCSIAEHLDQKSEYVIEALCEFIKLKNENI